MFGETTGISGGACANFDGRNVKIKSEPIFKASHMKSECDCNCCDHKSHRARNNTEDEDSEEETLYNRFQKKQNGKLKFEKQQKEKRGRNPPDGRGNITRCDICDSINHWASKCPDRESQGAYYQIALFENDLDHADGAKRLSQESIGAGIADCGATKTVCGKEWLDSYIDLLSPEEERLVTYKTSHNTLTKDNYTE